MVIQAKVKGWTGELNGDYLIRDIENTPNYVLYNKIHETRMAIDAELNTASDEKYRERLVKATYSLSNLEDCIHKVSSSLYWLH